jgi:hypothetical protein
MPVYLSGKSKARRIFSSDVINLRRCRLPLLQAVLHGNIASPNDQGILSVGMLFLAKAHVLKKRGARNGGRQPFSPEETGSSSHYPKPRRKVRDAGLAATTGLFGPKSIARTVPPTCFYSASTAALNCANVIGSFSQ